MSAQRQDEMLKDTNNKTTSPTMKDSKRQTQTERGQQKTRQWEATQVFKTLHGVWRQYQQAKDDQAFSWSKPIYTLASHSKPQANTKVTLFTDPTRTSASKTPFHSLSLFTQPHIHLHTSKHITHYIEGLHTAAMWSVHPLACWNVCGGRNDDGARLSQNSWRGCEGQGWVHPCHRTQSLLAHVMPAAFFGLL